MKDTSYRLGWALLGVFLASSAIDAGAAPASKFQPTGFSGPFRSNFLPASIDRTPVNVVVLLPGASVADEQAAQGRRLTRDEKKAVKAARFAEQSAKRAQIEGLGGQVTGAYQSALNGIRVKIPRNQLASLKRMPGVVDVVRVGVH